MAETYLSEIRLMAFNFAPRGWALCNGQLMPINQNQALFALLGTRYGGNGQTTFALPDLRGRVPIHMGAGFVLGQVAGAESHTLSLQEMPAHAHGLRATSAAPGGVTTPTDRYLGGGNNVYRPGAPTTTLHPSTVGSVGGGQPHLNLQPYLTLSFCIALQGVFPSPN